MPIALLQFATNCFASIQQIALQQIALLQFNQNSSSQINQKRRLMLSNTQPTKATL